MLLLTGATGLVGSTLLGRLLAEGTEVRCLVRDPRRLGAQRVRVQIALGDLTDPPSFRNALRGVDTVVHLAAAIRDQSGGSIEELNGVATWRMVQAAFDGPASGASSSSAPRARPPTTARASCARRRWPSARWPSRVAHTIFAPSIIYAPGDVFLTLLERLALLPVVPISGSGRALFQPIWSHDVADCVMAALERPDVGERYELSGPETLSYDAIVEIVLRAAGRPRRLVHVPLAVVSRSLRTLEALMRSKAFATWEQAELMEVTMIAARGTADAEALGVTPKRMSSVLGADYGPD
jgi:NADH dehydrogenase